MSVVNFVEKIRFFVWQWIRGGCLLNPLLIYEGTTPKSVTVITPPTRRRLFPPSDDIGGTSITIRRLERGSRIEDCLARIY